MVLDQRPVQHENAVSISRQFVDKSATLRTSYLLLSTSLLVDRVFLYSELIRNLTKDGNVAIWASSFENAADSIWGDSLASLEAFPPIRAFREMPHNYLRRLNELAWDYRYNISSRESMWKHVREKRAGLPIRVLKPAARVLAGLRMESAFEDRLEKLLLAYPRSLDAERRLYKERPDVIVSTGPYQFEQPAIVSVAKKLGIPTLAYIPPGNDGHYMGITQLGA